jgi:L,D-peptidoglycan transpeptidase YkuD (ErfK/YbiS/YcfS/YnhG family)
VRRARWALALLGLVAGLAGLSAGPVQAAGPPGDGTAAHVRLGGVTVTLQPGTTQVVTVNHTRGHHARVVLWVQGSDGWERRLQARDGRIGYGGLVAGTRRRQGTGTTPLGSYGLISAFGTHPRRAAWDLSYRRIRGGDFWVEDNASRFYNRYRNQRQGGFRWRLPVSAENGSERLTDYPVQYEYSVVTSFNRAQVRHRGAGIFLHVNGSGATAGCVSAPRRFLVGALARLDADAHPVIAIGR